MPCEKPFQAPCPLSTHADGENGRSHDSILFVRDAEEGSSKHDFSRHRIAMRIELSLVVSWLCRLISWRCHKTLIKSSCYFPCSNLSRDGPTSHLFCELRRSACTVKSWKTSKTPAVMLQATPSLAAAEYDSQTLPCESRLREHVGIDSDEHSDRVVVRCSSRANLGALLRMILHTLRLEKSRWRFGNWRNGNSTLVLRLFTGSRPTA